MKAGERIKLETEEDAVVNNDFLSTTSLSGYGCVDQGGMFYVYFLGLDLPAKGVRALSENDYRKFLGRRALLLSGTHVTFIRGLGLK